MVRTVFFQRRVRRARFLKCSFLHRKTRTDVFLDRSVDGTMTKPERDDAGVDFCFDQRHRGRVAQNMRRESLIFHRRTRLRRGLLVFLEQRLDSVVTQWLAGAAGEQKILAALFLKPLRWLPS